MWGGGELRGVGCGGGGGELKAVGLGGGGGVEGCRVLGVS